ncbi:hypothetical protein GF374_02875 [Candidatus Woesearchaeota archaeon]|nr:hypothetical protein [Candidatus Woesearchaeota archaeon]
MAGLEKELLEHFPEKLGHKKNPKPFGFSKTAEVYRDKEGKKVIGFLADFKLPDTSVEVIIGKTYDKLVTYISQGNPDTTTDVFIGPRSQISKAVGITYDSEPDRLVAYTSKESPDPEFTLSVIAEEDSLIRSIIKDPKTYAIEDVFTNMKKYEENGQKVLCSCPIMYVGEKYVIGCMPVIDVLSGLLQSKNIFN